MSEIETNCIHTGDLFDVLPDLPDESVHAVVTDPPYAFEGGFMNKEWDNFSDGRAYQEWCMEWAETVSRVLKPGGHLLAFGGNTNHHRLFTGVEDAGYEIRDTLTWHYGSGFPKALDVSKAIDKQADAEREKKPNPLADKQTGQYDSDALSGDREANDTIAPEPATEDAQKWDGFKTALKPATEYIVVARKELAEDTVAENVLKYGTGALNIDGTRIETSESWEGSEIPNAENGVALEGSVSGELNEQTSGSHEEGRYPSNVVFDEPEAERLDEQVGNTSEGGNAGAGYDLPDKNLYGDSRGGGSTSFDDSGGPSRYFYTSKASKSERTLDGKIDNSHPTVKPIDLMEWLVTLVTKEGQTVLDPFTGSGTTGVACKNKNREFIGIEEQAKWADLARVRCGLEPDDPSVVRESDAQNGLEQY